MIHPNLSYLTSPLTTFQQQLAVIASQLRLGKLLFTYEIVEFTHRLMNEGIYDDVMLDIIEVGASDYEREEAFTQLFPILGLTPLTNEQAKLIYISFILNGFATRPNNSIAIRSNIYTTSIYTSFDFIFDESLLDDDSDKFTNIIYRYDDATGAKYNGYIQMGFNDEASIRELEYQFFQECENWLALHAEPLNHVFKEIFQGV